ncbi:HvfC/BufC N-terminal domain-containing protein [Halomonas halmophila]|uniref:Putative DNA-binding domain-containing protein n=1 Tax=Halomonas halmophila TaxID=252 RepID=A0A4Y4F0L5_9GAMM|nr:DNA-binding domain-containing protein [Halomonas halmophila]GED21170.1 hypothetical protein HHA01_01470 [Halomonas halmophila]
MTSLAEWQRDFTRALQFGEAGDSRLGHQPGFDVYRNNVRHSLIEALAQTFPHTRTLLGERFFRSVASDHVRRRLPEEPRLRYYGQAFAEALERLSVMQDYRYVVDICRLEHARLSVSHAADAAPLSAELLGQAEDPQAVCCMTHPASRLVEGHHDVLCLWHALERGEDHAPVGAAGDWTWLLIRQGRRVEIHPVNTSTRRLYQTLTTTTPLGEALATSARQADQAQVSEALGTLLALGSLTQAQETPA